MFYVEVILTGTDALKIFLAGVIVVLVGLIFFGILGYVVEFGCYLYDKFFLFKKSLVKKPELSVKVLPLVAVGHRHYPITCAAVVFPDGKSFHGFSHTDCYDKAFFSENRMSDTPDVKEGFMDEKGNFLDRKAAMKAAKFIGQVKEAYLDEVVLTSYMLYFA